MGCYLREDEVDVDMINVGKEMVIVIIGVFIFNLVESFVMIRGGYVDFIVLGVFEVDVNGNIVLWMIFGKLVKGMGGVMDLVVGVKNIIVIMIYIDKYGNLKLFFECIFFFIGVNCIICIIIDLVVLEVVEGVFVLKEIVFGVMVDEI